MIPWTRGTLQYLIVSGHASNFRVRIVDGLKVRTLCTNRTSKVLAEEEGRRAFPTFPIIDGQTCAHCGEPNFTSYMVKNEIWGSVIHPQGEDVPMNDIVRFVYKMAKR